MSRSIDQIGRREPYVFLWLITLCFIAGYLNLLTINFFDLTTSHMTGNITNIAYFILRKETIVVKQLVLILLAYFSGGLVTGYLVPNQKSWLDGRYVKMMAFITILLSLTWVLPLPREMYPICISFILGLQNALLMTYRGMVIRTTHLTGVITELSAFIGHACRGVADMWWRIGMLASRLIAFFIGAITAGVLIHHQLEKVSLLLVSVLYLLLTLSYRSLCLSIHLASSAHNHHT